MNYRLLSRIFGILLVLLSLGMGVCAAYAHWQNTLGIENTGFRALAISYGICLTTGIVLIIISGRTKREILRKEAIVVVGLGWFISASFGMLPYILGDPGLDVAGAFFESMSGFTTTGSTVITSLAEWPRAILLWRALTQWLGGVGILVLFIALLSYLGAGGKSLFRVESSARVGEGTSSRIRDVALRLWLVYLLLSAITVGGLWALGMSFFDAICHAMATVATGGFGTHDTSIVYFDSFGIELFLTVMMLASSISFFYYISLFARFSGKRVIRREEEGLWFLALYASATIFVTINLLTGTDLSFAHSIRHASFQVATIMTTCGFASADFSSWPGFSIAMLFSLMFIGGCTGSTAGGVKIARMLFFFKVARQEVVAAFRPRRVMRIELNGQPAEAQARAAVFLIALFAATAIAGTLTISILEPQEDFDSCFSASLATLFNIGPGVRDVGPTENFAFFSPTSKIVMSLLMATGRLEIFAVFSLFVPSLWRRY